jgi:ribosomal protein L12E/L44/L45/RPP1/RPP2
MSRIYFAVPADRMVAADALSRGVPEDDEEDEEEQGEDQEQEEEDDDEGEGYSE